MTIYSAHWRPDSPPVLVREGFSWGALLFGPFWLFAHRAWIAGVLVVCAMVALGLLLPVSLQAAAIGWAALAVMVGLSGNDLRRWGLERRGYETVEIVAAHDADTAFGRLLERRPGLVEALAP